MGTTRSALFHPVTATQKIVDFLLAGRPLVALAVVWLTTAGHTMNLRELGVAQGWVPAELFSLQSAFLYSLALMLLPCPRLGRFFSARHLAETGLIVLAAGSFLNGIDDHAPMAVFWLGRALAGSGAALVIYFVPRLLGERWQAPASWAAILLPVAGPAVISAVSMVSESSDWEWGYFYEGGAALLSLLLLWSMTEATDPPPPAVEGSLRYWPFLIVGFVALGYILHWGQLDGWLEDFRILLAVIIGSTAFTAAAWLVWPQLHFPTLSENWPRLLLFFYGGLSQYFHGYTMNVYGGSLINFSTWQRSWLIWSMPLGAAFSLFAVSFFHRRRGFTPGLPGAAAGLALLAAGLYLNYRETLEWPFWQILDRLELNWFQAPSHWQLAPGRFLMGVGVGLLMSAMDKHSSADAFHEEKVHPFLVVMQTFGGAVGAGILVNFLLIGHLVQYSYSADRGYIQADELADRKARLSDDLTRLGEHTPEREAEVLVYRAIRYEADNMVFAFIYDAFLVVSLLLAALCLVLWARLRLREWLETPSAAQTFKLD